MNRIVKVVRQDNPEVDYYEYESEQEALDRVLEENKKMEVKNMFKTNESLYVVFQSKSIFQKIRDFLFGYFSKGDTKVWK